MDTKTQLEYWCTDGLCDAPSLDLETVHLEVYGS